MINDKEVQVPTPQGYNSEYYPRDTSYVNEAERDRSPLKQLLDTSNMSVNQGSQLQNLLNLLKVLNSIPTNPLPGQADGQYYPDVRAHFIRDYMYNPR